MDCPRCSSTNTTKLKKNGPGLRPLPLRKLQAAIQRTDGHRVQSPRVPNGHRSSLRRQGPVACRYPVDSTGKPGGCSVVIVQRRPWAPSGETVRRARTLGAMLMSTTAGEAHGTWLVWTSTAEHGATVGPWGWPPGRGGHRTRRRPVERLRLLRGIESQLFKKAGRPTATVVCRAPWCRC